MLTARQARDRANCCAEVVVPDHVADGIAVAANDGKLSTIVKIPTSIGYGTFVAHMRSLGYTVQRDGPELALISWGNPL